jgi:ankyrin repeat protein
MKKIAALLLIFLLLLSTLTACGANDNRADANQRLYRAITSGGTVADATDAVQSGAEIDKMRRGRLLGVNMVTFAVSRGRYDLALLLINSGADVNYKSSILGETLMMFCAKSCAPGLIRALIERGADVAAQDRVRNTALDYAFRADAAHTEREVFTVVQLLTDSGARVTKSALSSALAGYSGDGNGDGRYAVLKYICDILRAQGEEIALPPELEARTAQAAEPSDTLPSVAAIAAEEPGNNCNCECQKSGAAY